MILRLVSFFGLLVMLLLAWTLSERRREVPWRLVFWGTGLQFAIGAIMLLVMLGRVLKGHFDAQRDFAFEAAAWYWHFGDGVWLLLFGLVYWL